MSPLVAFLIGLGVGFVLGVLAIIGYSLGVARWLTRFPE